MRRFDQFGLGVPPGGGGDQRAGVREGQPSQAQPMDVVGELKQRVIRPDLGLTVRPDGEDPRITHLAREEADERQRRGICPVKVVEHHDQRTRVARLSQDLGQAVEHPESLLVGVEDLFVRLDALGEQLRSQPRHVDGRSSVREDGRRVGVTGVRPEHLDPRPERRAAFPGPAGTPEDTHPPLRRLIRNLFHQPSLADPRLAPDQDHRPAPPPNAFGHRLQGLGLEGAPDEGPQG
jgi:hypothetical protein